MYDLIIGYCNTDASSSSFNQQKGYKATYISVSHHSIKHHDNTLTECNALLKN